MNGETAKGRWRERFEAGRAAIRGVGRPQAASEKLREALAAFQEALEAAEAFGPDDRRLPITLQALLDAQRLLGDRQAVIEAGLRLLPEWECLPAAGLLRVVEALEWAWDGRGNAVSLPGDGALFTPVFPLPSLHRQKAAQCLIGRAERLLAARPAEAIPLLQRALRILERVCGTRHPTLSPVLHDLGTAYRRVGRLGDAEVVLRRSIEIERAYDPGHGLPEVVRPGPAAWAALAEVCALQREWNEAEAAYREALANERRSAERMEAIVRREGSRATRLLRAVDPGHVGGLLRGYAAVLRQLGRDAESDEMEARGEKLKREGGQAGGEGAG